MCNKEKNLPYNPDVRTARTITWLHITSDILAFAAAYAITFFFRFYDSDNFVITRNDYSRVYFYHAYLYIFSGVILLLLQYHALNMYNGYTKFIKTAVLRNAIFANCITMLLFATFMYFIKSSWHMRGFLPLVLLINIPTTVIFRILVNRLIYRIRLRYGLLMYNLLLVGNTKSAEEVKIRASKLKIKGFRVTRHIDSPKNSGDLVTIENEIQKNNISIVAMMDEKVPTNVVMGVMQLCIKYNKTFKVIFPKFDALKNPFDDDDSINGYPVIHFSCPGMMVHNSLMRNLSSRCVAAFYIVLTSPIFLLLYILVKREDKHDAIFKQTRYGVNGTEFMMYKFRSMKFNAEKEVGKLWKDNESDGALFKMRNDPRVTKFGKFLRTTSLDELPQFFNVLKGEMRFIGPRPLPVADLEKYKHTWHFLRQLCPPGISCIWQINGRSNLKFEDMCLLDIWYVFNRNWVLDLKITILTIWSVIVCRGAY